MSDWDGMRRTGDFVAQQLDRSRIQRPSRESFWPNSCMALLRSKTTDENQTTSRKVTDVSCQRARLRMKREKCLGPARPRTSVRSRPTGSGFAAQPGGIA